MIEWLLIGLLVGLTVGLVGVILVIRHESERKGRLLENILEVNKRLSEMARKSDERMINQLIMLRREGFQTIPEDEKFEAYRITPEQEAQWEEDQVQGLGGVNPESLVEG